MNNDDITTRNLTRLRDICSALILERKLDGLEVQRARVLLRNGPQRVDSKYDRVLQANGLIKYADYHAVLDPFASGAVQWLVRRNEKFKVTVTHADGGESVEWANGLLDLLYTLKNYNLCEPAIVYACVEAWEEI
jgi:hypothetical protein